MRLMVIANCARVALQCTPLQDLSSESKKLWAKSLLFGRVVVLIQLRVGTPGRPLLAFWRQHKKSAEEDGNNEEGKLMPFGG